MVQFNRPWCGVRDLRAGYRLLDVHAVSPLLNLPLRFSTTLFGGLRTPRELFTATAPTTRYLVANESHYYIDIARMLKESFPGAPVPTEKAPGSALKPEYDLTRASQDLGHKPSRTVAASLALQGQSFIDAGLLPDTILKQ